MTEMEAQGQGQPAEGPKERIRLVARMLISERGVDAVTTRDIARGAGLNVAAVNYHFGTKDNLAVDVFRQVARRSAEYRLEQLDRLEDEARAAGRRVRIRQIVESFVSGYFREDTPAEGGLLANLILKNRLMPTEWTSNLIAEELDGMARRYIAAIAAAAPDLDHAEVCWFYNFMVGTVLISVSQRDDGRRVERLSDGDCSIQARDEMREHLVRFITGGISTAGRQSAGQD
ncbi:TetR/AcrR family transcriptional regulator [Tistrella mobilis]|uniref:Transcriptional regulator n=1 Tax=Tistrella mobilis (strain KA081020-065) TaxID=1110502 RepID=I3TN07_TISMK|nr:TetR family transcriptional regulator [Tistrella mobilis]AFK54145.1 transcriptional regulator [Tistrella mobilis KA081020-065]